MPIKRGARRRRAHTKVPAKATRKYVKREIVKFAKKTVETKYFPTNASDVVDFSGVIQGVTGIPQGDTDLTRDGDSAYLLGISVNYSFIIGDTTQSCRIILFRWNQDTAAANPLVTDILDASGGILAPLSNYVMDNYRMKKFTILYDRIHALSANGTERVTRHFYKKLKSKVSFDAATTNGKGKLFILVISDSGAVTHPTYQFGTMTYFTDA